MLISRRSLVAAASLTAAAPRAAWAQSLGRGAFTHGVASGDPLPDGVILWTRFVGTGSIAWEVAEDEAFAQPVQRGQVSPSLASDFCAKVDVRGLQPGRRYFYRFLSASGPSLTGQTRTAPAGGADALRLALFSCSNFPFGYFHAYGHAAAREDIDLAVHCGDYIYEYQRGVYPGDADVVAGRLIEPVTETVRLGDYYQRYATYHTDPDLLELRRLKPMAVVWDDHEITNDAWREGAQNHQTATEGLFADRIAAASKAYFDWMPIRRPSSSGASIYRHLDWGDLARIVLIDTRYIGRDQQLSYASELQAQFADDGADPARAAAQFRAEVLDNPDRTLLGATQEAWFAEALAASKQRGQTWQVVAQQLVMAELGMPAGASRLLPEDAATITRNRVRAGERLSAHGLPWNLDSWGGYPAARTRFLDACAANANNAIVLGGDSHNCWVSNLDAPQGGRLAAVEFAGGSVSSPGVERTLSNAGPGERETLLRDGNAPLAWCDSTHRGYAVFTFTRTACEAEWVAFADVRSPQAGAPNVSRLLSEASASAGPGAWVLNS